MAPAHHLAGLAAALVFIGALVGVYAARNRKNWFRMLSGRTACTVSVSIVLFLLLVFGLVPQDGSRDGFFGVLGFRAMSGSPVFIAALLFLTACLTLNAIEDIRHFSRHRLGVTCAHAGVSAILILGIFGSGTTTRASLTAEAGIPTRSGMTDGAGDPVKLPFELTLKEFNVNEYAAGVTVTLPDGECSDIVIRVNRPVKANRWWIYLSDYSFDGGLRTYSCTFRCVRSPLSGIFRAALWLMLLCAAAMIFLPGFKPGREKERKEDAERTDKEVSL